MSAVMVVLVAAGVRGRDIWRGQMSYISVGRSHRDLITGRREQIDPTLIYKSMIHRYTARQIHKQSAAVRSVFPIDAQSTHACLYPVDVLYRGPIGLYVYP